MLATKRLIVIILSVCSFTVFSGIEKEDFQFDFAPIVEPLSENFEPLASDLTREQLDKIVHEVVEYEQEVHSWIYEISLNIELLRDVKNKLNNLNKGEEIEYIKLCKSYLNIGDFNKAYSVLSSYLSNPKSDSCSTIERAQINEIIAVLHILEGDFSGAEIFYKRSMAIDSTNMSRLLECLVGIVHVGENKINPYGFMNEVNAVYKILISHPEINEDLYLRSLCVLVSYCRRVQEFNKPQLLYESYLQHFQNEDFSKFPRILLITYSMTLSKMDQYSKITDIFKSVENRGKLSDVEEFTKMEIYVSTQKNQLEYQEVNSLFVSLIKLASETFGADHPITSITKRTAADYYFRCAKRDNFFTSTEIESLLEKTYDLYESAYDRLLYFLSSSHLETVVTLCRIGNLKVHSNQNEVALDIFSKALLESKNTAVSIVYTYIGSLYKDSNNLSNAIAAYTKALNSSVETYGEHHRGVSIIYTKLGNLYGDQGEWNQALACYYQSLVINDAIYNGENTAICMDRINIASSLCEFYDFDEANEHLYEGISMLLGMEERNPIAVANLYFNIAKNKESIDDYHGAAISYDKARSYLQEYSNANQSEIFSYMMSAAEAYEKGSEYDYAFDLYLEADLLINSPCNLARIQLANISSILGDHRRGLRQINNVVNLFNSAVISNYSLYIRCLIVKAKILYRSGREIEALGCYENAYKLNVECFGKENSVSIMILRETIKIFIEIGALEKAAKNLGTLIYLQENDLNNRAIESVETIDLIAKFNIKKEKFLIAEECLLDALQIRKNYLHDRHSEIAINYSVLGEFYCKLSNFDKALFYYKEAEKLFESTLGECNKTTIEFYSKLADFYVVCDNFKLVVEVRYKALCGARTIFGDTHEITLSYLADYIVACINNDNNHRIDELVSDLINGINDKSIKLSKDRYRSLLAIGKYYSLQGEHVAANEIFNLYLTHTVIYSGQKSREAVYARVMLSKSLIDGKKYEEALDVIKRAINIINESDVDSDVGNLMPLCQEIYRSILAKRI